VLVGSLAVADFFLIAGHRVHFSDLLPYALLALFIVFHLFMHGEYSRNSGSREPTKEE